MYWYPTWGTGTPWFRGLIWYCVPVPNEGYRYTIVDGLYFEAWLVFLVKGIWDLSPWDILGLSTGVLPQYLEGSFSTYLVRVINRTREKEVSKEKKKGRRKRSVRGAWMELGLRALSIWTVI